VRKHSEQPLDAAEGSKRPLRTIPKSERGVRGDSILAGQFIA
jgi:hypothetical protein